MGILAHTHCRMSFPLAAASISQSSYWHLTISYEVSSRMEVGELMLSRQKALTPTGTCAGGWYTFTLSVWRNEDWSRGVRRGAS